MTTTAEKLAAEASAAGLELIGPGRDYRHRTYRWLKCSHVAEYRIGNVRKGAVRCQTCLNARLLEVHRRLSRKSSTPKIDTLWRRQ